MDYSDGFQETKRLSVQEKSVSDFSVTPSAFRLT